MIKFVANLKIMNWIYFPIYALFTAAFWVAGVTMLFFEHREVMIKFYGRISVLLGTAVLSIFVLVLWLHLERPPMRTLGETRLWYSVFLTFIGFLIYIRWGYKVVLALSVAFALLFLWINFSHPEAYEKTLMPALQSPWFIPHVIAYILSYSVLGLSWLVAVVALFMLLFRKFEIKVLDLANNLVYMGFSLLTIGMVIGAIWAKEAWGHYWTWDPKETWAFLTWLTYLLYIHYRYYHPKRIKSHLWILSLIFVVLLICWFGLSYLPSAQNSVHVYAR